MSFTFWKRSAAAAPVIGASSDVGRVRTENQDAFAHFAYIEHGTPGVLCIVADGMGGHAEGAQASRIAVEEFRRTFFRSLSQGSINRALEDAFRAANRGVYERSLSNGVHEPMGTTCTALVLSDGRAFLGHVGDSRAYRVAGESIEQLTHDHTLAQELYRQGAISRTEISTHPRRNTLTRALGIESKVEVDLAEPFPTTPGERYVLCSDGLGAISSMEIQAIVRDYPVQEASERLVAMANDRGGHDNVTVLIVERTE